MKFGWKKNNDKEMGASVVRKGEPGCGPGLLNCELVLDRGVIAGERSQDYSVLVNTMMNCHSSICSFRTNF